MSKQEQNIVFDFYKNTLDSNFVFSYRGVFTDELTSNLVGLGRSIQNFDSTKRKISYLLVECFQNVLRHSEESHHASGYFSFRIVDNTFLINSVNVVKTELVPSLVQRVVEVNLLNEEELKKVYRERLVKNSFNEKGGAGLGLIEIARKSGQELKYEMEEIDDGYYYFHQQITLKGKNKSTNNDINSIEDSKNCYHQMMARNTLLQYKGSFSRDTILPMLTIIESNLAERKIVKKIGHVLMEMFQNISKHNTKDDKKAYGVCVISEQEEGYVINTGNVIDSNKVEVLKERITKLNDMNQDELRKYHSKRILEIYDKDDEISTELGLIEIAKHCTKDLEFDFKSCENGKSFFSFYAMV